MTKRNIEIMERLYKAVREDVPSSKEVASVIAKLIEFVKASKKEHSEEMADLAQHSTENHEDTLRRLENAEEKLGRAIKSGDESVLKEVQLDLAELKRNFVDEVARVESRIPTVPSLEPLRLEIERVRSEIPAMPESPEEVGAIEVRDKLETLEGDDRLDKSAIKGLTEELKKLSAIRVSRSNALIGGRIPHIPMVDDFSDQTNGVKKTFYISKAPRSITTTKVWGSDFPHILRANTDFTVSGKLLTLTSEVDAPSEGATLIVEYYT